MRWQQQGLDLSEFCQPHPISEQGDLPANQGQFTRAKTAISPRPSRLLFIDNSGQSCHATPTGLRPLRRFACGHLASSRPSVTGWICRSHSTVGALDTAGVDTSSWAALPLLGVSDWEGSPYTYALPALVR